MHRWETVGGWSGAANKAFLGQMVEGGGWDGEVVELDRCGLLFSKQAPFFFFFFFFSSAITSIMAIQRAKQAILQWTVWARF